MKPKGPQSNEWAMNRYSSVMREIKLRLLSINSISQIPGPLMPPFAQEYGYLQLRMCCELIGIACLVAHGDIAGNRKSLSEKAFKPGEILTALEELHPDFFPVSRSSSEVFEKENRLQLGDPHPNAISKEELVSLWARSGDFLHRGGLKHLDSPKVTGAIDLRIVTSYGQKILDLLSIHTISRRGGRFHFLTYLSHWQAQGDVLTFTATSPEPEAN